MKRIFFLLACSLPILSMDFTDIAMLTTTNGLMAASIFGPSDQAAQKNEVPITKTNKNKKKKSGIDSFATWKNDCNKLPKFGTDNRICTVLKKDDLYSKVNLFLKLSSQATSLLTKKENWLKDKRPPINFFDFSQNIFQPYVQKLVVPSDAIVAFHGDLHGDIHTLNQYVAWLIENDYLNDQWEIINDNFYMIFLGDYTDRGWYGAEVIYTILKLKCANPKKVFLVRGNHEDTYMNLTYGFAQELRIKFREECENKLDFNEFKDRLYRIYNYMPVALYIGCPDAQGNINYLQCCHGGMEIGFNPIPLLSSNQKIVFQLLGELKRYNQLAKLQQFKDDFFEIFYHYGAELNNFAPESPGGILEKKPAIGFMWYDFIVEPQKTMSFTERRGWACGQPLTKAILQLNSSEKYKVRGVFRAHQHSTDPADPMMRRILNKDNTQPKEDTGVGKLWINENQKVKPGQLWDGIVCTFCVAPCTPYGQKNSNDFSYDAFGLLKMSPKFEDWQLEVVRQEMVE